MNKKKIKVQNTGLKLLKVKMKKLSKRHRNFSEMRPKDLWESRQSGQNLPVG